MRKKISTFVLFIIILTFGVTTPKVEAKESKTLEARNLFLQSIADTERNELMEKFNSLEVVNENYGFAKYVLKDESKHKKNGFTEDDFNLVPTTIDDFILSKATASKMKNGLSKYYCNCTPTVECDNCLGFWQENDYNHPVVMTGITAFRDPNDGRLFTAIGNFTWSRKPHIQTSDAYGFTCGPTMQYVKYSAKVHAEAIVYWPDYVGGENPVRENILYKELQTHSSGQGLAQEIKLNGNGEPNTGYIEADFRINNYATTASNMTFEYLSTTFKLGDLGFDGQFRPSFGLDIEKERMSRYIEVFPRP